MININECKTERHYYVFSADSEEEIENLPTYTSPGKGDLATIKMACGGSFCYVNTPELPCYVLNADEDEWQLVE